MARRLLLVAAVGLAASLWPAAPAGGAPRPLLRVVVNPGSPGTALPRSFVGFSFDYRRVTTFLGSNATGLDDAGVRLFNHITRQRSGAPLIRVGGPFTDKIWWNPTGARPVPNGIEFDLGPGLVEPLGRFATATGSPLIMGVNLAHPDHAIARDTMLALNAALGDRIQAFELGHEPDTYDARNYGTGANGRPKRARPAPYTFAEYIDDFTARAAALEQALPGVRVAGPGACCDGGWFDAVSLLLDRASARLGLVTYHQYTGSACPGLGPSNSHYTTVRRLLSNQLTRFYAGRLARIASAARARGKRVRLTQTASAACGGRTGVSDTFASALWAADWLFQLHYSGLAGVDFDMGGTWFRPFALFPRADTGGWAAIAAPSYYGILLFARATAGNARLIRRAALAQSARPGANVHAWSTRARNGTVRVTVLNKDLRDGGVVEVKIRRRRRAGRLIRLTAPGVRARDRIKLGGRSVSTTAYDGRLVGRKRRFRVRRRRGGVYAFRVPRASAALLEVRR